MRPLALVALAVACASQQPYVKNDPESYRRTCESPHPEIATAACYELAGQYARGEGVPVDPVKSTELLARACQGRGVAVPHACAAYGLALLEGHGVARDWKSAERWLDTACELGSGTGCLRLALLVEELADPVRVTGLYAKACDAGEANGCLLHGLALASGKGAMLNPEAAKARLQRACELGSPEGCEAASDF